MVVCAPASASLTATLMGRLDCTDTSCRNAEKPGTVASMWYELNGTLVSRKFPAVSLATACR